MSPAKAAAPSPALAKKLSAAGKSRNNKIHHGSLEILIQHPPPALRRADRRDTVVYSDFNAVPPAGHRSCCLSLCAWACVGIFTLTIVSLIVGISCLVFLRSSLPAVNVFDLHVDNPQQPDSPLELELAVRNENQKLELIYGDLAVDVTCDDLKYGGKDILGFRQSPQNENLFNVQMKLVNAGGEGENGKLGGFNIDGGDDETVFNVFLSGAIGFKFGRLGVIKVPFSSACYEVKQSDVRLGIRPKCRVRMFAFR